MINSPHIHFSVRKVPIALGVHDQGTNIKDPLPSFSPFYSYEKNTHYLCKLLFFFSSELNVSCFRYHLEQIKSLKLISNEVIPNDIMISFKVKSPICYQNSWISQNRRFLPTIHAKAAFLVAFLLILWPPYPDTYNNWRCFVGYQIHLSNFPSSSWNLRASSHQTFFTHWVCEVLQNCSLALQDGQELHSLYSHIFHDPNPSVLYLTHIWWDWEAQLIDRLVLNHHSVREKTPQW